MRTLWAGAAAVAGFLVMIPATGAQGETSSSPLADALRVEFVLTSDHPAAERFYEARDHAPLWLARDGGPTPAVRALLAWAGQADRHALPPGRYDVAELDRRLESVETPEAAAALELDLTQLFLTYARDLSSGVLEPRDVTGDAAGRGRGRRRDAFVSRRPGTLGPRL